jgi:casein kinase II subunit beta
MYRPAGGGGAGLDRKRISDALDKHLEKAVAVALPSTSRGSAGGGGRDHHRLVVPSSATSIPKGRCSEGDVAAILFFSA